MRRKKKEYGYRYVYTYLLTEKAWNQSIDLKTIFLRTQNFTLIRERIWECIFPFNEKLNG